MDKKVMIIGAVAVVAIVAVAAIAIVLSNNNSSKDYNAKELAEKFVENYDGQFGEFKIQDGADEKVAKMVATVDTYARDGTKLSKTRDQYLDVYHYDTVDEAKAAFNKFLVESKNGSSGDDTLLTKTDVLGMAKQNLKLIDLREDSAGDYGADHAYFLYASSFTTDSTKYSKNAAFGQVAGAFIDGKNVIVFNTSTYSLYLNKTINSDPITGERSVTVAEFEAELVKLCKAF